MWFVQPLYVVSEFVTAAKVTAPYSFVNNTISDLGAATCTTVDYPHGPVPVCSPWHGVMNASFVVFGLLLLVGAVLLRRTLPSGVAATVSVVLWVVSGLSSIGTGLVPLDRDLALHSLLSLPVFLAQPVAIITLGVALRGRQRALALVVGVVSLVGTVAFLALTGSAEFGGLAERLALWPGYLWLPVAAWSLAADRGRIGLRHGV